MSIQEQLAQSQQASTIAAAFLIFGSHLETGILGNYAIQKPTKSAGVIVVNSSEWRKAPKSAAPSESDEMGWLVRNARDLGQYKGEWLLIQGAGLIIHDRNFAAVREQIRARQIHLPFVYYVPTDDESNSITI